MFAPPPPDCHGRRSSTYARESNPFKGVSRVSQTFVVRVEYYEQRHAPEPASRSPSFHDGANIFFASNHHRSINFSVASKLRHNERPNNPQTNMKMNVVLALLSSSFLTTYASADNAQVDITATCVGVDLHALNDAEKAFSSDQLMSAYNSVHTISDNGDYRLTALDWGHFDDSMDIP